MPRWATPPHDGSDQTVEAVPRSAWSSGTNLMGTLRTLLFAAAYQRLRFRSALLMYFLILLFGSIPHARAEIGELASGVVLHSLAYAAITFLLMTGSRRNARGAAFQAVLIVVVMGAADEWLQSFFPYRHAAVSDWAVDCIASCWTALLLLALHWKKYLPLT